MTHPQIVPYVKALKHELGLRFLGPEILGIEKWWNRAEWGPNGNPHDHFIGLGENVSTFSKDLEEWVRSAMPAPADSMSPEAATRQFVY